MLIYINAECGRLNKGFISDCIGTFGEHKRYNLYVQWIINDWEICWSGEGFLKPAGEIQYHGDRFCMDTTRIFMNIYRCGVIDFFNNYL